ncbi:MAG: dihydropteroate synthase [Bacteroidales bacterium]|nr:dihydropteroate synthase [Bacteroidales bacterium]
MNHTANFHDPDKPLVMGILNITPDSFYDGGHYLDEASWLKKAEAMLTDGAAIIDIGGASTRPGASEISATEEWQRISPVLESILKAFPSARISVDTYHSSVARQALESGAAMINDITGGTFDPEMATVIGSHNVPYVIMHMQGRPVNMQDNPGYNNIIDDIYNYFKSRIKIFEREGARKLILDPGFGFGKTVEHNYQLLKNLMVFQKLGYPVMAGVSRKSMINKVLGTKPGNALNGTSILNTIALLNGARILRVHDVREAVEVVKLVGSLP